ncbi:MAG: competence protein CoiA family protein [Bacteroidota bacterium]
MELKLPYGFRDNELVTIEDVESGLKCNCICPSCKKQLIARKGNINDHHFAHLENSDCGQAIETIVHRLSKEIISKEKYFVTPQINYPGTSVSVIEETEVQIDDISLESKLGSIIPDIIIKSKSKSLIVEIKVTHEVTREKERKIMKLNLPAIEVNASKIIMKLYSNKNYLLKDEEYKRMLIDETAYKYWINNPKYGLKLERLKSKLKDYCDEKEIKYIKYPEDFDTLEDCMYYIEDCPLNKRIWRSGWNKGKSYAKYDGDCYRCKYNPDLMKKSTASINKMYCAGHQINFNDLLKEIIRELG